MKNNKPKAKFKKPIHFNKALLKTLQIVLTALTVAILTIVIYFIAVEGWQVVVDFLTGTWGCLFGMVIIFAATIIMWIISAVNIIRKVREDDNNV